MISELVSMVDVAPTLLDAVRMKASDSMRGKSVLPLLSDPEARHSWPNEAFIQVSQSQVGRAVRTREWTYYAIAPDKDPQHDPGSDRYEEYQMYCLASDPAQLLNLAGRKDPPKLIHEEGDQPIEEITAHLRERLIARMVEAGEAAPHIEPKRFYP